MLEKNSKYYIEKKYGLSDKDILITYALLYDWFTELHSTEDSIGYAMKVELDHIKITQQRNKTIQKDDVRRVKVAETQELWDTTIRNYYLLCEDLGNLEDDLESKGKYLRTSVEDNQKMYTTIKEVVAKTLKLLKEKENDWKNI